MAPIQRLIVSTLDQFHEQIRKLQGKHLYRGQLIDNYQENKFRSGICPGILREYKDESDPRYRLQHRESILKELTEVYKEHTKNMFSQYYYHAYMQHIGLVTDLLDFTLNPDIALYFAFSKNCSEKQDHMICAINISAFKQISDADQITVIDTFSDIPNMKAQQGVLIKISNEKNNTVYSLEQYVNYFFRDVSEHVMIKLMLSDSVRDEVSKYLYNKGIDDRTLFPESPMSIIDRNKYLMDALIKYGVFKGN